VYGFTGRGYNYVQQFVNFISRYAVQNIKLAVDLAVTMGILSIKEFVLV
jgi:hypothetical protein